MTPYTDVLHEAMADMAARLEPLQHVDMSRLLVLAGPRWRRGGGGTYAVLRSLADSDHVVHFRYDPRARRLLSVSEPYRLLAPRVVIGGQEQRYVLQVRMPRLCDGRAPLLTLVHELLHIHDRCDGTFRPLRHGRRYDEATEAWAREWLRLAPAHLARLAQMTFGEARRHLGRMICRCLSGGLARPVRMPSAAQSDPRGHPAIRRLRLQVAADVSVVPVRFAADRVPRVHDENDLVWCEFSLRGVRRLSPEEAAALGLNHSPVRAAPEGIGLRKANTDPGGGGEQRALF